MPTHASPPPSLPPPFLSPHTGTGPRKRTHGRGDAFAPSGGGGKPCVVVAVYVQREEGDGTMEDEGQQLGGKHATYMLLETGNNSYLRRISVPSPSPAPCRATWTWCSSSSRQAPWPRLWTRPATPPSTGRPARVTTRWWRYVAGWVSSVHIPCSPSPLPAFLSPGSPLAGLKSLLLPSLLWSISLTLHTLLLSSPFSILTSSSISFYFPLTPGVVAAAGGRGLRGQEG